MRDRKESSWLALHHLLPRWISERKTDRKFMYLPRFFCYVCNKAYHKITISISHLLLKISRNYLLILFTLFCLEKCRMGWFLIKLFWILDFGFSIDPANPVIPSFYHL